MGEEILVIGSGGREHCLAWKFATSKGVKHVYVCPGNGGTVDGSNSHISNLDLKVSDFAAISKHCKANEISLVVVGPEDPLANGIVDHLKKDGIPCFGPSAKAAQIEASKEFAKGFMDKHAIPTAKWKSFTDPDQAQKFIREADFNALVVKASGLAAGKGVVVCRDRAEACDTVKDMLAGQKVGSAGHIVVIEELLEGHEVSCLAFSDGKDVVCFPPAQDHKRLLDMDEGPNTGGMGAYCPCPLVSNEEMEVIKTDIIQKTIDGMEQDGIPYIGILYAGIMLTSEGPKVLEFNCRFGDPETQVLLPLLKSDLHSIMKACVNGNLKDEKVDFLEDTSAVGIVLASEGYPGKYPKGLPITGIDKVQEEYKLEVFHAGTKREENKVLTNGGRVLAVVALDKLLATAAWKAQLGASKVKFEGKYFRKDIAHRALQKKSLTYQDSGVDIDAGEDLVNAIKPAVKTTGRLGCTADLGGFGGVFDVKAAGYKDPLLVSGTDGVGTKLKVAQQYNNHVSIGQDLVAMCVNDVLCHGAEPLFFLDYFACGKLDVNVAKTVVEGITEGCKMAGCALIGGETAEMSGMYSPGEYDLAGFAVGAVERDKYLPTLSDITPGDVIIGLQSNGLHSNGFSLVRRVIDHCKFTFDMICPWDDEKKLGEALLVPTKIYVKSVLPLVKEGLVKAIAHITGGGLPGNLSRILQDSVGAKLDSSKWNIDPVFSWISQKGNVSGKEMAKTFNLGIGMVLVAAKEKQDEVIERLKNAGEKATLVGCVCKNDTESDRVTIQNLEASLDHKHYKHPAGCELESTGSDKRSRISSQGMDKKKKVGVLISGTGTNLQALIDHTKNPVSESCAEIVLVISNKANVEGLKRAEAASIDTMVINHKDYSSREEFDEVMHKALTEAEVEVVCLAGFMRILSGRFVQRWKGKLLNVHPSLLPAFKGMNAHKQVIEAGVCVSGCTVHFVDEEVDAGAIVVQETVPVKPGDTEETLSQRVKSKEHVAFPKALELLASGQACLGEGGKVTWK